MKDWVSALHLVHDNLKSERNVALLNFNESDFDFIQDRIRSLVTQTGKLKIVNGIFKVMTRGCKPGTGAGSLLLLQLSTFPQSFSHLSHPFHSFISSFIHSFIHS